jgi:hypothetical protein
MKATWQLAMLALALMAPGVPGDALAQAPTAAAQPSATRAPDLPWPRKIAASNDTTLALYQPQIESWDGFRLVARSAVHVTIGKEHPQTQYGIVTLQARTLVDKGRRLVTFDDVQIVGADFPASPSAADAWRAAIVRALSGDSRAIALDRLESSMSILDAEKKSEHAAPRNDAPRIVFSAVPGPGFDRWRADLSIRRRRALRARRQHAPARAA